MRIRSWGGSAVTSSPKNSTRPRVAAKSPVTTLNSVVLPAPLAPITARRSLTATENETSSIAVSAPNTRVTFSSRSASPGAVPFVVTTNPPQPSLSACLRTIRLVARTDLELGRRHAERLVHVVDLLEHAVLEIALRVLHHLGDERRADRLPVRVELHVAYRRLQGHLGERVAVLLLPVRQIALHEVQAVERRLHVDVVDEREQRGARIAIREVLLVVGHERLELGRLVRVRDRRAGDGADQRVTALALVVEDVLAHRDRAADDRLVAAGLLVLVQEVHRVGPAEHHRQGVHVLRDARDHGGVVLAAEGHPRLDRHLAAELAVLGHEALYLRVGEGVVLGDHHHLLVALVEGGLADAHHPLAAVGVEAEEVRRGARERRGLRARRAVDEGDVGLGLRVFLDRDALGARERTHHDVDLVLLDQLARRVHRDVGLGVGRGLDDLDLAAGDYAVTLAHRELGAAHAVLTTGGERALERRQQADLDRRRLRERAGGEGDDHQDYG